MPYEASYKYQWPHELRLLIFHHYLDTKMAENFHDDIVHFSHFLSSI